MCDLVITPELEQELREKAIVTKNRDMLRAMLQDAYQTIDGLREELAEANRLVAEHCTPDPD